MINGVHHVSISTTNIEPMVAFYSALVGLEVIARHESNPAPDYLQKVVGLEGAAYRHAWISGGNVAIEIFEYIHPRGKRGEARPACDAGIRHICFDVTD